ncbi:MAG: VanZ family protein [Actinobacteria bacterium]|nr:VanZ family protein [Actinomycetota bacterium]MCL5882776.1 VanZ family protein [Actinomycetota bacterium]
MQYPQTAKRTPCRRSSEHGVSGRLLPWLAVLAWASLIFYLSAQPDLSTGLGSWDLIVRKIAHVGEFAILTSLLWFAITRNRVGHKGALLLAAVAALIYAASDEFHQHFVPGRIGTPRDVAIDSLGIIVAALIILGFGRKFSGASRADVE